MRAKKSGYSKAWCVFCGQSSGAQFAMFNPRFAPFGTACVACEEKLPEGAQLPDPAEVARFRGTCPEFQAELMQIAEHAGKTVPEVYALWRKYSQSCESSDQSPVLGEFAEWYKKDLAPVGTEVAA